MKNLEFQDYTQTLTDEDGDEHDHTVRAAVVTDDLVYVTDATTGNRVRREVMTPTGQRQVIAGDVFVETDRPGVYDHMVGEAWSAIGYADDVEDAPATAKKATAKRALPDGSGS